MRRNWNLGIHAFLLAFVLPLLTFAAAFSPIRLQNGDQFLSAVFSQKVYVVKPGDTLWSLASKLNVSVDQLLADNDITDPRFLQVGQKIYYHVLPDNTPTHTHIPLESALTLGAPPVPRDTRILFCTLTAYTAGQESTGKSPGDPLYGVTSTGKEAVQGITVAVDPRLIPYGTKLYIPGVGYRIAEDTGGAIVGTHIDVYYNDVSTARAFGLKHDVPVYILPSWYEMPFHTRA